MNFIKSILRNLINVIFVKLNVNISNVNLNDVSGALHKAWAHIFNNNLHGLYIEFGVYKGNSEINSRLGLINKRCLLRRGEEM